mmetsp:Transcript_46084/g.149728  ORF Transcript_46084/g.149728 Transcript_46084/m.149728 type:complete len:260 (+) Transcript_46084:3-782(+)
MRARAGGQQSKRSCREHQHRFRRLRRLLRLPWWRLLRRWLLLRRRRRQRRRLLRRERWGGHRRRGHCGEPFPGRASKARLGSAARLQLPPRRGVGNRSGALLGGAGAFAGGLEAPEHMRLAQAWHHASRRRAGLDGGARPLRRRRPSLVPLALPGHVRRAGEVEADAAIAAPRVWRGEEVRSGVSARTIWGGGDQGRSDTLLHTSRSGGVRGTQPLAAPLKMVAVARRDGRIVWCGAARTTPCRLRKRRSPARRRRRGT